ncbi:MAG: hypothetical protein E7643_04225 [Ruminococcaceae bacterium]|nr:hypothetical protein [Oscillospiraceae bacterium]
MLNKKTLLTIAGAAGAVASGTVIADFIVRKASRKNSNATELVLGIAGLVASASVIAYAHLSKAEEETEYEDMLTEEDIALMDANISEVLGASAEQSVKPAPLNRIEVDEEATIEDFI